MSGFSPTSSHSGSQSTPLIAIYGAAAANAAVSIAPGTFANQPWVLLSGTALLNLTDPTDPLTLAAGFYSLNGYVLYEGAAQAGKYAQVTCQADAWNLAPGQIVAPVELDKQGLDGVYMPVAFSWPMAAGTHLDWACKHNAAAALDFKFAGHMAFVPGPGP